MERLEGSPHPQPFSQYGEEEVFSSSQANGVQEGWKEVAQELDATDPLAEFRQQFTIPPNVVYLDGNSLGLPSKPAEATLLRQLEAWKTYGIDGWTNGDSPWFFLAEELAAQTAPLIGATPDEVIVTNSTTVNLHQLLATLYAPAQDCAVILADALNFPSDLYALQSHLRLRGLDPATHLSLVPGRNGLLEEDDIIAHMTPDVQVALLPAVVYTTAQLLDIGYLTAEAHRRNILIGFDCSHSIGAVPHDFDAQGVDFAFWCSYKYLNGGPGASGGLYLNRRHFGRAPGLAGWFGSAKERQFDMAGELIPAPYAGALQIGTPNIFSLAPLQGALELFALAGMEALRGKSLQLTDFLMRMVDAELSAFGVSIINPREEHRRGGHVALLHPEAMRVGRALRAQQIVPDFRPPNTIRLAPIPLYNSFMDCYKAVYAIRDILQTRAYEHFDQTRDLVS